MSFANFREVAYSTSRLRDEIISHLDALAKDLDFSGLYHQGRRLRISENAVEPFVIVRSSTDPSLFESGIVDHSSPTDEIKNLGFSEHVSETPKNEHIPFKQAVTEEGLRLAVRSDPGGGKTFITKRTAISIARESARRLRELDGPLEDITIPIWMEATKLAEFSPNRIEDDLVNLVRQREQGIGRSDAFYRWYSDQLRRTGSPGAAQYFIFIDGLDELKEENVDSFAEATERLRNFKAKIIIACRTWHWENLQTLIEWPTIRVVDLVPFTPRQQEEFIKTFFKNSPHKVESFSQISESNHVLRTSFNSPLLLTFACMLHGAGQLDHRTTNNGLYQKLIGKLFSGAYCSKAKRPSWLDKSDPGPVEMTQHLFDNVGWQMFSRNPETKHFELKDWNFSFRAAFKSTEFVYPEIGTITDSGRFLSDLQKVRLLVITGEYAGKHGFSYLHRTFLEFAAARALSRMPEDTWLSEARNHFWDFGWWGVLRFLAGEVENISKLISAVRNEEDDVFGTMKFLTALLTGASSTADIGEVQRLSTALASGLCQISAETEYDPADGFCNFQSKPIYRAYVLPAIKSLLSNNLAPDPILSSLVKRIISLAKSRHHSGGEELLALGDLGLSSSIPALLEILNDANAGSEIRSSAARALGKLHALSAEVPLTKILLNKEEDVDLRKRLAQVLRAFPSENVISSLLDLLVDDSKDRHSFIIRTWSAVALNSLDSRAAIDRLMEIFISKDGDPEARDRAADLLTYLTPSGNQNIPVQFFVERLRDRSKNANPEFPGLQPWRRGSAALILARLGVSDLADEFLNILRDKNNDWVVRNGAAMALAVLKIEGAIPVLADILHNRDEPSKLRWRSVRTLVTLQAGEAASHSIAFIRKERNDDPIVCNSIISAFGQLGILESIPLLINFVKDNSMPDSTRSAAASALGEICAGTRNRLSIFEYKPIITALLSCRRKSSPNAVETLPNFVATPLFRVWRAYQAIDSSFKITL